MTSRLVCFAKFANALPRLATGKVAIVPNTYLQRIIVAGYHSSPLAARKSGSKALEPKARPPSKKQAKRKSRQIERESKVIDHKKEKLKMQHMTDQFNSEEMQSFIADLRERLDQPLSEVMLPDGISTQKGAAQLLPDVDPGSVMLKLAEYLDDVGQPGKSILLMDESLKNDANLSLLKYAGTNDVQGAMHMYNVMNVLCIPVETKTVAPLIRAATRAKDFELADTLFNKVLNDDTKEVDMTLWAAKIHNLAHRHDPAGAEKVLDDLIKLKLTPQACMYSSILGSYCITKRYPEAYRVWMRMHLEGADIDLTGFHHMFEYCRVHYMAERAFFFWDEMAVYGLEPTLATCRNFLRAVGMAPHYVPGYQDTMFDAMAIVEGREMVPSVGVYEAVLEGFSRARDPVATEYYFWEMKRKGLAPTARAYTHVLESYCRAQTVGASKYGHQGRYSKPAAKAPTPDQQDLIDLGPIKVAKILNSNVYTDYEPEKHGKRVKRPRFIDAMDDDEMDDEERREQFMEEVRHQAAEMRAAAAGVVRTESDNEEQQQQLSARRRRKGGKQLTLGDGGEEDEDAPSDPAKTIFLDDVDLEALAGDEKDFLGVLRLMKEDKAGTFDGIEIDGMTFRKSRRGANGLSEAKAPSGKRTPITSAENLDQKQQAEFARQKIFDLSAAAFEDPFDHMDDLKGKLLQQETPEEVEARLLREEATRRLSAVSLLDNAGVLGAPKKPPSALVPADRRQERDSALQALDFHPNRVGPVTDEEIHRGFDMVYFGRAPDADYSMPLNERRKRNIHRAELVFKHMVDSGIRPTPRAMLMLLGVYCEAQNRNDGVDSVLARYAEYNITPTPTTFRMLVKMHMRNKDLEKAVEVYESMRQNSIVPDRETYGLLIETHTHRENIVEALKLLEDAAVQGVEVPERNLRFLRGRCTTLGVTHPDLSPDPHQWVKDVKETRRKMKQASQRHIEPVRSLLFN